MASADFSVQLLVTAVFNVFRRAQSVFMYVFILVYSIKTKDRRRDRMRTTVCSLIYSPLLSSFVSEVNILGYPAKVLWSLSSVAILTYQKGCDIHK